MILKVAVHGRQQSGAVEYHNLAVTPTGVPERYSQETQRIVLCPPGVVRDTVALVIRSRLAAGESCGEVEGVQWEKMPAVGD